MICTRACSALFIDGTLKSDFRRDGTGLKIISSTHLNLCKMQATDMGVDSRGGVTSFSEVQSYQITKCHCITTYFICYKLRFAFVDVIFRYHSLLSYHFHVSFKCLVTTKLSSEAFDFICLSHSILIDYGIFHVFHLVGSD